MIQDLTQSMNNLCSDCSKLNIGLSAIGYTKNGTTVEKFLCSKCLELHISKN
jgi:hypothetical protein